MTINEGITNDLHVENTDEIAGGLAYTVVAQAVDVKRIRAEIDLPAMTVVAPA